MENKMMKFYSKSNGNIVLRAVPGHFATSHSHVNYYVDMTGLKSRRNEAAAVARAFAQRFNPDELIDTIVCMDGCEVIGAYLAEELENRAIPSINKHQTFYIITPEVNVNNQMIFRDNLLSAIAGKHILLLSASNTTGLTIGRSMECVEYYGGTVVGICSVFSAMQQIGGQTVEAIFTPEDIPGYQAYESFNCPFCKTKQKLDAIVNGYGYAKL